MSTILSQSNVNPTICLAVAAIRYNHLPRAAAFRRLAVKVRAFSDHSIAADTEKLTNKPPICTADELHYVAVGDWKLALWRYNPSPQAPTRNHPLLLLSGVGTNAIGYDLAPGSSFARHMCDQGFDTWILEVRGAGLSIRWSDLEDAEKSARVISDEMEAALDNGTNGTVVSTDYQSPLDRILTTFEDFQKQLDLIIKYDWDFDHYLEEDIPAVVEYLRAQSKPKDGRLLAIGHSMGGILLYAMLSQYSSEGRDPGFAGIVTLASSLDYTTSKSSLKVLVPLADPAQALNVPVVPLGALLTAAYPLSSRPPYVLGWLKDLISAEDMMHPELLKKLVLNNFCNISAKLILQLTSVFRAGGLRDRRGTFLYKDHLHKINVPVLALAGDRDLICPPEAVYETAKLIPEHLVTYKVFGEPNDPHYAHYDLVGARVAAKQLYPCIIEFLSRHDSAD